MKIRVIHAYGQFRNRRHGYVMGLACFGAVEAVSARAKVFVAEPFVGHKRSAIGRSERDGRSSTGGAAVGRPASRARESSTPPGVYVFGTEPLGRRPVVIVLSLSRGPSVMRSAFVVVV